MSTFPNFSNIKSGIQSRLNSRKGDSKKVSGLNAWVRLTSGTDDGLTLYSNPDVALFGAAGIYGDVGKSGTYGFSWGLEAQSGGSDGPLRPSPIVSSMEIDEGAGNLSRKASFSITCFTKSQMEQLVQYYLEPGYSIFIEWGWNTPKGAGGLITLGVGTISAFQSFQKTDERRATGGYEYDNYLGFITGGSLSVDGDKWTITASCTGYTELPAYLNTSESGAQKVSKSGTLASEPIYGETDIENAGNLDVERFMKCYNNLPGTRQTAYVKALKSKLSNKNFYIGFDEQVAAKINDSTDGSLFGLRESKMKVNGQLVSFPVGTKIVSEQKFIKFSALMQIINAIGVKGYKINNIPITMRIQSAFTLCSAFENIYSIDATKLFIPNQSTPAMKLTGIPTVLPSIDEVLTNSDIIDNTIGDIQFPSPNSITQAQTNGAEPIKRSAYTWGKLDDLYVNFDFAKGILDTKNFAIKDALYQILNGMSSAVNGMWDFQITEHGVSETTTELRIHELNCITEEKQDTTAIFDISGPDCIFIDASFDMDISAAKMNQVISSRLETTLNGDNKDVPRALFSEKADKLNVTLVEVDDPIVDKTTETDIAKETNLNLILGKLSFYPKVEFTEATTTDGLDLYETCYLGAFNDSSIFSAFKDKKFKATAGTGQTAPLMNINFSFKVHGISGIKRGDKFNVNGIPDTYRTRGFFQVLSVKHVIDGMLWTTEVTGGFRPNS